MTPKSRLHIHTHKGPHDTAYIIGEKSALRALADALKGAANGVVGLETLTLYTSDGHAYNIVISSDVSEEEWQNIKPSYDKQSNPTTLRSIEIYKEYKQTQNDLVK
jgi:hypothetical protein